MKRSWPAVPETRVLFVTPMFGDGGGERIWLNLLRRMDRRRFHAALAYCEHMDSAFMQEIPGDVGRYDLGKSRRMALDWPRIALRLAAVIRTERPDVVVSLLHTWGFLLPAARLLSGRRFATVINEHIHVSGSLRSLRRSKPLAALPVGWIHRYCYRNADLIVPVAREVGRDVEFNYGAPAERIRPIYNGIDQESIERMAAEPVDHPWFTGGPPVVVGIGRLTDQKGFACLIRAFRSVVERLPARLAILGEGEKRSRLESLISGLGLEQNVSLLGWQTNPFKYLARADLFVLSSVGEALPTVILEAMALGIPVVSTNCPAGPAEILEGGRHGVLVPVGDREAMTGAIARLLEDSDLRAAYALRSRRRAGFYRLDRMVRSYETSIEELVCA
jgi:glycosyltransferase involved in cell wall biosynthesis